MKMSIREASEKMGISAMFLRLCIREGKLNDIAFCVKNKERFSYYINRSLFESYINNNYNRNSA